MEQVFRVGDQIQCNQHIEPNILMGKVGKVVSKHERNSQWYVVEFGFNIPDIIGSALYGECVPFPKGCKADTICCYWVGDYEMELLGERFFEIDL
jgi:hypothetical protein